MRNTDQWSAMAEMLGNLIAKYAEVLDIDTMSENNSNKKVNEDLKILNKTIKNNTNI